MRLGINAVEEELERAAAFCRVEGIGLEVTAFAYPATLDGDVEACLDRHARAVEGVPFLTVHGPFLDLYPASPDPRIVELCRDRHERALEAAKRLGAEVYVAHLNSNPMIRNRAYRNGFVASAADFWRPLADDAGARGITIVLENMWERGPGLQRRAVEEAAHPHLRASFDNGHALVFSDRPATAWLRELGDAAAHLHLHDNDGEYDEHRVLGEGVEDWAALVDAIEDVAPDAVVILENDYLAANRRSLERLRRWTSASRI